MFKLRVSLLRVVFEAQFDKVASGHGSVRTGHGHNSCLRKIIRNLKYTQLFMKINKEISNKVKKYNFIFASE